ncbi:MAG: transcriptional regulator, partial [Streptosporangiaceae bacterium]
MFEAADAMRSIAEMADTLVHYYDVVDVLTGLADRCVSLLGVTAAGVMLASPGGSLGLVASSSETMRLLELFELQA